MVKNSTISIKTALKKKILIGIAVVAGGLLLIAAGWLLYFKLQFAVYHDDEYKFSIKYPKSWKVVVHPRQNVAVIFLRPKDTALDTVQENFNVTIQPLPSSLSNLAVFSSAVKKQVTDVFGKNVHIIKDANIHIGWREGHEMAFNAPKPDHLKMVNAWVLRVDKACIMTFLGDMNKYGQDFLIINEMIHSLELQ